MNNGTEKLMTNRLNLRYKMAFDGIFVGLIAGLIAVFYRLALNFSEKNLTAILNIADDAPLTIVLWIVALALMGVVVGQLVRWEPFISGSGIPQVEGELLGHFNAPWLRILPAKLLGGFICIFAGLSLGREGPSVQLGAMGGKGFAKIFKRNNLEERYLITCGASAGLAAAFNAPLAGVMFALEEVHKNFSATVLFSAMTASVVADIVSKVIVGMDPVFQFDIAQALPLGTYWLLPLLGVLLGVSGAFYNWFLEKTQGLYTRLKWLKPELRPVIPFVLAGILGFTLPQVLGGGHLMIDVLMKDKPGLLMILGLFTVKFLFSMVSFGSGAPGGIFFPLLVLGAYIGGAFGHAVVMLLGLDPQLVYNFAILAMAGYFTAIVRAPLTGIVLICEMTGSFDYLLSLAIVVIIAEITAGLCKAEPVYEMLLGRMVKNKESDAVEMSPAAKTLLMVPVHHGSDVDGVQVKAISWPENTLLVSIQRAGGEIIPHGETVIMPSDMLVALANKKDLNLVDSELHALCKEPTEVDKIEI